MMREGVLSRLVCGFLMFHINVVLCGLLLSFGWGREIFVSGTCWGGVGDNLVSLRSLGF